MDQDGILPILFSEIKSMKGCTQNGYHHTDAWKHSLLTLYNYTAIGFFLNLLPGRLGEPVRGILLAREEKIDKSYGLASVVVERMIDFLMMILIFCMTREVVI